MLIREVILENFMSYEYARVPLKPGVNVVCGPNGSGKSSLLLGICVALGDTYTERSKKLSDLIRWDAERARVTLVLDNRPTKAGYRPVPQFNMDEITLTRTLRRDGKYGFQLNQRGVSKAEVVDLLGRFGFDPNNMLIIMHQAMPTRFANLRPRERLQILEEAVGYVSFRNDIIEAKDKLTGVLSEEESLNQLLQQARETLNYWREQNERLQEKKQLETRMLFLQREMAWSKVMSLEEEVQRLQRELDDTDQQLYTEEQNMERNTKLVVDSEDALRKLRTRQVDLFERRINFERLAGVSEYSINTSKNRLTDIQRIIDTQKAQRSLFESTFKQLRERLEDGPTTLDDYFGLFSKLGETQSRTYETFSQEFIVQKDEVMNSLDSSSRQLVEAEQMSGQLADELTSVRVRLEDIYDQYIDARINMALLSDKRARIKRRIEDIKATLDRTGRDLRDAEAEALIKGQRVETGRDAEEILGEIRRTTGMLMGMSDVPDEAEEMYENYNRTFKEIEQRIEEVRENRRRVMEEIEERKKKWREVTEELLKEVNVKYNALLKKLQATGETRLINPHDIEEAGLELYIGFKGAAPQKLDPYTHSGGERSSSVMAFLLALQQNVLSPFRAVDEFDLHMDPRNKEAVSDFIVSTMEDTEDQYMAITPSQITFKGRDVHIIMVHKTDNVSEPRIVEASE